MSKKNSNVILKNGFRNYEELFHIYSTFNKKLNSLKKKTFLVAVSGGPDSLALTALAKSYSYENKCKIYYVLVDHNLRKNSSREAKSVKRLLKKHQIDLNILKSSELKSLEFISPCSKSFANLSIKNLEFFIFNIYFIIII